MISTAFLSSYIAELFLHEHTGLTAVHHPRLATAVQSLLCMSE